MYLRHHILSGLYPLRSETLLKIYLHLHMLFLLQYMLYIPHCRSIPKPSTSYSSCIHCNCFLLSRMHILHVHNPTFSHLQQILHSHMHILRPQHRMYIGSLHLLLPVLSPYHRLTAYLPVRLGQRQSPVLFLQRPALLHPFHPELYLHNNSVSHLLLSLLP